jgi:hypothetical protein
MLYFEAHHPLPTPPPLEREGRVGVEVETARRAQKKANYHLNKEPRPQGAALRTKF